MSGRPRERDRVSFVDWSRAIRSELCFQAVKRLFTLQIHSTNTVTRENWLPTRASSAAGFESSTTLFSVLGRKECGLCTVVYAE